LRFFDCHASFGLPTQAEWNVCLTAAELLALMDRHGIERALVRHAALDTESPPLGGALALEACSGTPRLEAALPLSTPQTGEFPLAHELAAWLRERGARALWARPEQHRYRLDTLTFGETFEVMAEERIPLLYQVNGLGDWDKIAEILREFPDLTLLAIGHGCWGDDRLFRPLMDRYPRLHLDMSRYELDQGIARFVDRYGPRRLLFGTSAPRWNMGGPVAALMRAPITEDARAAIAGENLERLLSWDGPGEAVEGEAPRPLTAAARISPLAEAVLSGPQTDHPIVDTHGHFGPYGKIWLPSQEPDQMVATMDRCGVRVTICSHHTAITGDAVLANRWLAEQGLERYPDRLLGYYCWNPHQAREMEAALEDFPPHPGFVGLKFHPSSHGAPLDDPRYAAALEYANAHRWPVLSHTWGGSPWDGAAQVDRLLSRYPDIPFLMGHSCFGDWDGAIRVAKEHPNAYLELTAAYAVAAVIARFVAEAGSERILMGTDLPWFDPMFCIGCILFSEIDDAARANILYRNAARLFPSVSALLHHS
jgi:predicted TIM-barrel fold metal-dependent hydrolase